MPFTNSFKCFLPSAFPPSTWQVLEHIPEAKEAELALLLVAVFGFVSCCLPSFISTLVAVSLGLCLLVCPLICLPALLPPSFCGCVGISGPSSLTFRLKSVSHPFVCLVVAWLGVGILALIVSLLPKLLVTWVLIATCVQSSLCRAWQ